MASWLMLAFLGVAWGQVPADAPQAYDTQHLPAAQVAPQIRSLLERANVPGEVILDRNGNRLWVRGGADAQRIAQQLIGSLDAPAAAPEAREVRAYPGDPSNLAGQAEGLRRALAGQDFQVVADERTRQLLVMGTPTQHRQVSQWLSRQVAGAAQPLRTEAMLIQGPSYQLRSITWRDLEDRLKQVWGERLSLSVERGGEVALINANSPQGSTAVMSIDRRQDLVRFADSNSGWGRFVQAIDSRATRDSVTRIETLKRADPRTIERAVGLLQRAATAEVAAYGAPYSAPATASQTAPQATGPSGTTIALRQLPQPPAPDAPVLDAPQPPEVQPGVAPNGEPGAVPPVGAEEDDRPLGNVELQFIPELGVVIIKGIPRDVDKVKAIIEQIRQQSETNKPEIDLVALRHVNSESVGDLLVTLYTEVFAPRFGTMSITALDKPNALLLIGSKESIGAVKDLLAKLDEPVPPATQLKVFPLKHVSCVDVERTVREFFTRLPSGTGGGAAQVTEERLRTNLGTRVRVVSDFRSNSLIVQAAPRDMAEVETLIQSIDIDGSDADMAATELRVFRLQNALATQLAPTLIEAITGQGQQQQQQPIANAGTAAQLTKPSAKLSIIGIDQEGNQRIDSGILTDITITADPNVNSLIVRAPSASMDLVTELIRQLDQLPDTPSLIKVFRIENGDATNLTAMLQSLFGLAVTAGQGVASQQLQQLGTNFGTTGGEGSLVPLRFAVDVRTNSIIATGSESDLNVVEVLLLRLDEGDIENRKIVVYRLRHAPALDIANSISTYLANQSAINQAFLTTLAVSPYEQVERQVFVVPELVTNSLIVSATPRYYDQIMKVINDLDYRKPMVMVQVVIAQVKLSDAFELGVELGLQDSLLYDRSVFTSGSGVPGFNFNNTTTPLGNANTAASMATRNALAGQALSNFALGRQSSTLNYGGMVLSAASDSMNILVRALQDAGRMQILSRPQVMTLDNQPAFVQVGARVPRIVASNITPQGGTQNTTNDENVGLLLRIQPKINSDGLVLMNIDTEKSEVGPIAQGIPIAINNNGDVINSPQINTTTAQTTISAHSGQTVVFAGLITKERQVQSRRVPYLSDIPVLGRLFGFDAESEVRSELLVFMTPYIIDDDHDYDWMKFVESERMSWCLADLIEMHGDVGLSGGNGLWGPPRARTIYPDQTPTADLIGEVEIPDGQVSDQPWQGAPQSTPLPGQAMPLNGPVLNSPETVPSSPVPNPLEFGANGSTRRRAAGPAAVPAAVQIRPATMTPGGGVAPIPSGPPTGPVHGVPTGPAYGPNGSAPIDRQVWRPSSPTPGIGPSSGPVTGAWRPPVPGDVAPASYVPGPLPR